MNQEISQFKHLLEYFICHQNYMASGESRDIPGFEQYIKPLLDRNCFYKTGQGYADGAIQKQVNGWDYYSEHQVCINIQPNFGNYTSKKSYLNWRETGINIFCMWDNNCVKGLAVGYAYWWKEPTIYEIIKEFQLCDLGLYVESSENTDELTELYLLFMKEYENYRNKSGKYYELEQEYNLNYKLNETMGPYVSLLKNNYNIILSGAPGTGKTYFAKQIAAQMIKNEPYSEKMEDDEVFKSHVGFTQFHPSYDYTDFVEGLRPTKEANGFIRTDGTFKKFCKKAINSSDGKPYIFIIDEINRGEISKIFGELFFSVDPGYRGIAGKVNTQYQNMIEEEDEFKSGFYVPNNVYIIGTMNDIDRSVESMDFAFRRRFAFKEIYANENTAMLDSLGDLGKKAANRMKHLNFLIWHKEIDSEAPTMQSIEGLSSAFHIGASYFLKLKYYKEEPDSGFNSLWKYHIDGVLKEYLRGTEDIDKNIERLKNAFDDDSDTDYGQS